MDAPTYSLNQKWSVKKSIYEKSLFYVSILVPFVLFPAAFFPCRLNTELFIAILLAVQPLRGMDVAR